MVTSITEEQWNKRKWEHFEKKEGTKIFRAVNSNYCSIIFHVISNRYGETGRKFLADIHSFTQKLVTERFQRTIGTDGLDYRVDYLLNNLHEHKLLCKKPDRFEVLKHIPDEYKPLAFVDSGGLQLFRIRLGLIEGDEQKFIEQIPEMIERQQKLGDVLFCMDYIPPWERGKALKKSILIECAEKTIQFTVDEINVLERDNSDAKILPIMQMAQLPPHGFIWYDMMKEAVDFSSKYVCGVSLTGFNRTGNSPTENTMLYNVAFLTKIQKEIYDSVGRPYLLTHILGLMIGKNEFLMYGMLNDNFNHVSVDAVTLTNAYHKGYFYFFPIKNIALNGFGDRYIDACAYCYSLYGDYVKDYFGLTFDKMIRYARMYHVDGVKNEQTKMATDLMRALFMYFLQIVISQYFATRINIVADKYGKIFNQIKEDPDYYLHMLSRNMVKVPLLDDVHDESDKVEINDLL